GARSPSRGRPFARGRLPPLSAGWAPPPAPAQPVCSASRGQRRVAPPVRALLAPSQLGARGGSLSFAAAPPARPQWAHRRSLVAPLSGTDTDRRRTPAHPLMADPPTTPPPLTPIPKTVGRTV